MAETRGTRVYVGNLCEKVKKEDLEGEFTKYGKLNSVWVAFNPPGFAFVEYESKGDAEKACNILNGTETLGSKLRVEISKSRPKGRNGDRFGGGRSGSGPIRRNTGPGSFRSGNRGQGSGRDGFGGGRDGFGRRNFNGNGGGGDRFRSRSPRNSRF